MISSMEAYLYIGVRDGRVTRVREILNVVGDDLFDVPLSLMVRGFQKARGIQATGAVDEETGRALGLL